MDIPREEYMSFRINWALINGVLACDAEPVGNKWKLTIKPAVYDFFNKCERYADPVVVWVDEVRNGDNKGQPYKLIQDNGGNRTGFVKDAPVAAQYELRGAQGNTVAVCKGRPELAYTGIREQSSGGSGGNGGGYGAPSNTAQPASAPGADEAPF
jgi:hypothetical protein